MNSDFIGGELKHRIADFRVMEIDPSGKICEILALRDTEKIEIQKNWPEKLPEGADDRNKPTAILIMEKFNIDTNSAIRMITRSLGVSIKRIGYAGLKDKRAITSQRISVWDPDMERLKNFKSRYVDLRFLEFGERIDLGQLKGNEFEITVRKISLPENELKKRIDSCINRVEKGVPNYFGEQRFGGERAVSHIVGEYFVKRKFREAIMTYLTHTWEGEEPEIRNARMHLAETNDFGAALKEFPQKFRYERAILHHLYTHPNDFVNSFRSMPKSLRYIFTHAYQSALFNEIIDERIRQGIGLEPVEGDILSENGIATAALFGFEGKLADGKPGEIEKIVLEKHGLKLSDFNIREFAELSSKGGRKEIMLKAENLKLIKIDNDEYNEGCLKASFSFGLKKGCYATTIMKEIMGNNGRPENNE